MTVTKILSISKETYLWNWCNASISALCLRLCLCLCLRLCVVWLCKSGWHKHNHKHRKLKNSHKLLAYILPTQAFLLTKWQGLLPIYSDLFDRAVWVPSEVCGNPLALFAFLRSSSYKLSLVSLRFVGVSFSFSSIKQRAARSRRRVPPPCWNQGSRAFAPKFYASVLACIARVNILVLFLALTHAL